jgi:sporulation protein YqfC
MSKKSILKKHIYQTFDLPKEIILDTPIITLIANTEIKIENHKGIIEYTPSMLKMNSMLGTIRIKGINLQIKEIDQCDIIVNGEISSLEFVE